MASKAEKANYRYSDFYCLMSLTDFMAYISSDDEGETFAISSRQTAE